jgi:hypothetical protein
MYPTNYLFLFINLINNQVQTSYSDKERERS